MFDSKHDACFMAKAIKLAEKGRDTTTPNPCVGCVIVKDGELIAGGYHAIAGQAHAEVIALEQAGHRAQGSTLYVTLEPCNHFGRTGPCSHAIVQAKVARVVIAMEDPNPAVNGEGIQTLRDAGIQVDIGIGHADVSRLNRGFIRRMTTSRPFVFAKTAASFDARSAMANGESQWITGESARKDVQKLRALSCAIVTGVGTVIADDPSLNVRLPDTHRQPLRVILDSGLRTPVDAKILNAPGQVLICTTEDNTGHELAGREGVEVLHCAGREGRIDVGAVLDELGRRGMNNVMIEAGPSLIGSMIAENLLDEVVVYMAPDLLGSDAKGMFNIDHLTSINDKIRAQFKDVKVVGRDLKITLDLRA